VLEATCVRRRRPTVLRPQVRDAAAAVRQDRGRDAATERVSVRVDDLALIEDAMARLRAEPPTSLGGRAVERADDLAQGSNDLPPTDGLRYVLADGGRVVVRPSGTEPKLKAYLEVVVPVTDDDVVTARRTATADLAAIKRDVAEALNLG
jgi:phosphomannomutase